MPALSVDWPDIRPDVGRMPTSSLISTDPGLDEVPDELDNTAAIFYSHSHPQQIII
jgi:hypothetical protein